MQEGHGRWCWPMHLLLRAVDIAVGTARPWGTPLPSCCLLKFAQMRVGEVATAALV